MIFLEQLRMDRETPALQDLLQIREHALADAGNGEHLLGIDDQLRDAFGMIFDRLRGVAVRADAERVGTVDLEQISRLVQQVGNCFVLHGVDQLKQSWREEGSQTKQRRAKTKIPLRGLGWSQARQPS